MIAHTFFTAKEVSEMLRLSLNYTYFLLRTGAIPAAKVGYFWRIPKNLLEQSLLEDIAQRSQCEITPLNQH